MKCITEKGKRSLSSVLTHHSVLSAWGLLAIYSKKRKKIMRYNIFQEEGEYLITRIVAMRLLIRLEFSNLR